MPNLKRLLKDRSIILVSNRGPVEFCRNESGAVETRRGGGGLVTAMTAISEATQATWISAAMTDIECDLARDNNSIAFPSDNPLYDINLVDIPRDVYNDYYNVISNPLLWFIHHYLWDLSNHPSIGSNVYDAWHNGYLVANKLFAEAAAKASAGVSNPIIMLQDYHLFVAAQYIRELTDRPFLFHFTHIPWPEPNYMSVLPFEMRRQLLQGMLANDIVGFQSRHYAGNFLLCCEALLGCTINWRKRTVRWQNREVQVRTYPISIDHQGLSAMSERDDVKLYEQQINNDNSGMRLIVRTDRSDPSKNIIRGFYGYDTLLRKHPELKGKVTFLAFLYPTRESIREYQEYKVAIEETVRGINERHKTDSWQPIRLRIQDNYPESVAALTCYDVLLVNPIFDGMNLVAKEGPVVNKRNGVLVLSENAGAVSELSGAGLIVNPFDVEETANALYEALMMSEAERHNRASHLKEIVLKNNSVKWLYYQIKDIIALEKKRVVTLAQDIELSTDSLV